MSSSIEEKSAQAGKRRLMTAATYELVRIASREGEWFSRLAATVCGTPCRIRRREVRMAIRSIIVASAVAAGAAMAFTWGLSSIGPEPTVEIQEVPDRAWRVDIE